MLNHLKAEEPEVVVLCHSTCQRAHAELPSHLGILQLLQACKSLQMKHFILCFCGCHEPLALWV
jgi:hypothetical protein